MSDIVKILRGTLSSIFEIKSVLLKDNSGVLQVRNISDTAYARIEAGEPQGDNDVVVKKYVGDIPAARNYLIPFHFENISSNATTDGLNSGAVMFRDGEIVGLSIWTNRTRTAGTAKGHATINGVSQNLSGQYVVIDDTNTSKHYIMLETPITYSAGDYLGARVITSGFSPQNTKAVMTIFTKDR